MKTLIALLLTIATVSAAEIVSWLPNPPDDFVLFYRVHYANNPNVTLPWPVLITTTNTVATNTAAGKAAYYVVAVNLAGDSDPSAIAVQKPGKPATPTVIKQ